VPVLTVVDGAVVLVVGDDAGALDGAETVVGAEARLTGVVVVIEPPENSKTCPELYSASSVTGSVASIEKAIFLAPGTDMHAPNSKL